MIQSVSSCIFEVVWFSEILQIAFFFFFFKYENIIGIKVLYDIHSLWKHKVTSN